MISWSPVIFTEKSTNLCYILEIILAVELTMVFFEFNVSLYIYSFQFCHAIFLFFFIADFRKRKGIRQF